MVKYNTFTSKIKITTLSGNEIKFHSNVILPLTINDKILQHNFLVTTSDLAQDYDIILGIDFLSSFQCKINFVDKMVTFDDSLSQIHKFEVHKINVLYTETIGKLVRKVKVKPNGAVVVKVKSNCRMTPGSPVLLTPINLNYNVEMHHSLCTVDENGQISLMINNLSQKNLHLNKNMKVARINSEIKVNTNESISDIRRKELKLEDFDMSGIPIKAKQDLSELILEYADIFSTSLKTIGKCTLEAPPIEITDFNPIQCRPFPVPVSLRDTLKNQISDLENAGIIEKTSSRYSFPLILVRKKEENQWRLVIDYRKLNKITISSTYKLPLISDILNSLRGANYFSTLDANSSFHQIKLREEDKHLTAFSSPYGNFQYKYLSFGMKNSAQIFQELADKILNGLQSENISAYIDDVIVPSQSISDSIRKLRLVFERFRQFGLTLNPKKCKFLQTSIRYLGHIVDKEGLKPLPDNLNSIKCFPVPNTLRKLRRFLGLANYYRDFIPNFSGIVAPLTDLTKYRHKFKWNSLAQSAFDLIKAKLLSDVMLKHPNFEELFYLNTDASSIAVGAALLQKDENGILRPISYFSYKLKPHEKKWPAIHLEAYAILLAVRHFKIFLYGRKFTILSDCKSLNYLVKLDSPASKLSRWLLELSNYDFDFKHIKGSENFLSDLLSRDIEECVNIVRVDVPDLDKIKYEQRKDPFLIPIIDYLEGKSVNCRAQYDNYFLDEGLVKRITSRNKHSPRNEYFEQIVIPKSLVPHVLEGSETVHFSFSKNYRAIKEKYFWPGMYNDIKNFSTSCKLCIERKGFPITKSPLQNFVTPSQPMELVSLDILGPLPMSIQGNKYVLTVIDHFTKFSTLYALKDITAQTIANKLIKFIIIFGIPNSILTDLGTNFQSNLFNELSRQLQIHKLKTTPYRPQTNSVSERLNLSIKTSLTCLSETTTEWDTYLNYYNFIYNNSYHDTTHEKPSFLMFNRDLNLPFHVLEKTPQIHYFPCDNYIEDNLSKMQFVYRNVYKNLKLSAEKQSRLRQNIAKKKSFQLGQKVYLYTPATNQSTGRAFSKKFSGPYRVIEKHSDLNYSIVQISKPRAKPIRCHVDRLFAYEERRTDLLLPDSQQISKVSHAEKSERRKDTIPYWFCEESETDDYCPPYYHSQQKSSTNNTSNTGVEKSKGNIPDNDISNAATEISNNTTPVNKPTHSRYNLRSRAINADETKSTTNQNASITDRLLKWAITGDKDQTEKNIVDKMSDALANKLLDLQTKPSDSVNTFFCKPHKTRIYYRTH